MSEADDRHDETSAAGKQHKLPVLLAPARRMPAVRSFFSRLARALFGWRAGPTRADIEIAVEAAIPGETDVSLAERAMLKNILALRERRIEDVKVPRADIVAVRQDITLGELVKTFQSAGHSRLVVYNDTLDDPIGMVHIRDLLAFMTSQAAKSPNQRTKRRKPPTTGLNLKAIDLSLSLSASGIVREILFVPPSMPAIDLLAKMQATRIHLALVIDEYGGTDGLVSIEDIVEQIVGEIADEHEEEEPPAIVRQADGSFLADARASLDDARAAVGVEFDAGEAAKEVGTLGGYLMARVGRLPLRGELVQGPSGFEIEVLDCDLRRIKKVRIHRRTDRGEGDTNSRASTTETPASTVTSAPAAPTEEAKPSNPSKSPGQP